MRLRSDQNNLCSFYSCSRGVSWQLWGCAQHRRRKRNGGCAAFQPAVYGRHRTRRRELWFHAGKLSVGRRRADQPAGIEFDFRLPDSEFPYRLSGQESRDVAGRKSGDADRVGKDGTLSEGFRPALQDDRPDGVHIREPRRHSRLRGRNRPGERRGAGVLRSGEIPLSALCRIG